MIVSRHTGLHHIRIIIIHHSEFGFRF
jgi:hypothetical protein